MRINIAIVANYFSSCALTLMQKGADINLDIINKPKADQCPDEESEVEVDKTYSNVGILHQDNTFNRIIGINTKFTKKPAIKWLLRHYKLHWKPGSRGYPLFQVCTHCIVTLKGIL